MKIQGIFLVITCFYFIFITNYSLSLVIVQCSQSNSTMKGYCLKNIICTKLGGTTLANSSCPTTYKICCSLFANMMTMSRSERSNDLCDSVVTAPIELTTPDIEYFKEDRSCSISVKAPTENSKLNFDIVSLNFNSEEDITHKFCKDDFVEVNVEDATERVCNENGNLYENDENFIAIQEYLPADSIHLTINTKARKDEKNLPVWKIRIIEESFDYL